MTLKIVFKFLLPFLTSWTPCIYIQTMYYIVHYGDAGTQQQMYNSKKPKTLSKLWSRKDCFPKRMLPGVENYK